MNVRFFMLMAIYGIAVNSIESTWLSNLPFGFLRFDLSIVAIAFLSFYEEWKKAIPAVIFLGLLSDISSFVPMGLFTFSYFVIYLGVRTIISKISFQGGYALLFWVAVVSFTDKCLEAAIFLIASGSMELPYIILRNAPLQMVLDAVTSIAVIPLLRWYTSLTWEKIFSPKGLVMK